MSDSPPPAHADLLWLQLSGGLIRGIGHELNNRIGAVRAVAQVLMAAGDGSSPLEAALVAETERLQRTADLLRLLPPRAADEPEPVRLAELVPELLALLELHAERPEIRYRWVVEGDPLPVRVEPSRLLHALGIVLLAAAARADHTPERTVALRCRGTESVVEIEVAVPGERGPQRGEAGEPGADPSAAGPLLAGAGGRIARDRTAEGGERATLSLPTLLEVRRREREARGS